MVCSGPKTKLLVMGLLNFRLLDRTDISVNVNDSVVKVSESEI